VNEDQLKRKEKRENEKQKQKIKVLKRVFSSPQRDKKR